MEYRKTGRGGAGNYYSQEELEKATRAAAKGKDIEAQKDSRPVAAENAERKSSIAHAGRGGAGNFIDRETLAKGTTQNADITPGMQERRPSKTGYQGRGGVGNYKDEDAERVAEQARRASLSADKIHQEAVEMVDMTFREPERAHLRGHDEAV